MHRLHLQEWIVGVERDRNVRPRELQVDEQWAEPAVGFDDAFVGLVTEAVRQVGGRAYQQAPAGRGTRHKAAPEHQPGRVLERAKERGGISFGLSRRDAVEMRLEVRKLRRLERIPIVIVL